MNKIIEKALKELTPQFAAIDDIALSNQRKVLDAFIENRIALRHFAPTSGYGYDDVGRDTLCKLYACVFGTEDAIVSPSIASGTHALTVALFGLLRPGDTLLSATGSPYDTLLDVIYKDGIGSLKDFGIGFEVVALRDGKPDLKAIEDRIRAIKPTVVTVQRSRGYEMRPALSVKQINDITCIAHEYNCKVLVDNCYGEFVETIEPSSADLIVGSLIKNPGGGLAPTGGYIAGTRAAISMVEGRLTSPSIGREVGSYAGDYRPFYQGLFVAPHVPLKR